MEKPIIQTKSLFFAQQVYKLCKSLDLQKEYIISKQLLRCGTSIGANIYEAYFAESTNDYIHKLSISLKEINETVFWLELLKLENLISSKEYLQLIDAIIEIRKILISIIKKLKLKK
jgi:four helix bundle protein